MKKVKKELNDLMMFTDEALDAIKNVTDRSNSTADRTYFAGIAESKIICIKQEIMFLNA